MASKDGKRLIEKLENKLSNLEGEFEREQRFHRDSQKECRIYERKLKEFIFQSEQDHLNQIRCQETIELLQKRLKICKRQTEEAEEIAQMNIGKYRLAQQELEAASDRAEKAELFFSRTRAKHRGTIQQLNETSPIKVSVRGESYEAVFSRSRSLRR